ncbi:hypothetical protein BDV95DRAFT_609393 [Massariosphaeria phaeospora]|uniref:Transcription factor domain-containing protein n=1 Tax=Massariosphaeria phaeospora TaxID=100035 RepID=A0A7C8M5Q0_9PLEO|nr:hypothetical protein BDV95DRAFT_609393 [Massariosphaeria phaeospora]
MAFQVSTDRLLNLFYENFWPGLPATLPLHYLCQRKMNDKHGLEDLLLVMQWIGSVYAAWTPSEPHYETALRALSRPILPRSPFTVQALMFFSVAQYHWDLRLESRLTLDAAIDMALELQMNTRAFASTYGEWNPVLEESWRRTWYVLKLIDQHLAVVVNNPTFALRDIPESVDLPCEDVHYESGQIPPPSTWQEYDTREFADVEVIYSSLTYAADICRVVTYIMTSFLKMGYFDDDFINTVDTKVAVWRSLLPHCKREPQQGNGDIDEVMFFAHQLAGIVTITAHRPFSSLTYSIEELSTESFVSPVPFIQPPKSGRNMHTARALKAIESQTKLLAIPCHGERHHIFAACITASVVTAQISACKNLLEDHAQSIGRDRVRLSIGYLNRMGSFWPLVKKMTKEARFIARQSLVAHESTCNADSAAEIEVPRDELLWPVGSSSQIDIYSGIVLPVDWEAARMNYASSSSI